MKNKEFINCEICNADSYTAVSTQGRDYIKTEIAICENCGFVYQNPRWCKESILKFYQFSYDKYYRATFLDQDRSPEEYKSLKWGFNPLFNRIEPFVNKKDGLCILDVGSGEGTNLKFLGTKYENSKLFAIEPSHAALKALNEKGINVISNDVDSNWHQESVKRFDIITLRHVFEHLLYPNEFLQKVKSVLKADGVLYIAVPDAYNLADLPFSRDFSRIVHNYYFTKLSLTNIIQKNGLKVLSIEEGDKYHDSELFVVVGLSDVCENIRISKEEHDKQLQYLKPFIARDKKIVSQMIDFKNYILRRIYPGKIKLKKALGILGKN